MRILLRFAIPSDPEAAQKSRARIEEAVQLINEDKEEQAIEPAFFTGNLPDYPDWLREACARKELLAELETFGACEPGELAEWDLETWYEDLLAGETWDLRLHFEGAGGGTLSYEVEGVHYGGDLPLAFILFAAGAKGSLERLSPEET